MGLTGWLGRRVLAALLLGPLIALWFILFTGLSLGIVVVPCSNYGPGGGLRPCQDWVLPIAVLSLVAAVISDWLIIRAVKRSMKQPRQ